MAWGGAEDGESGAGVAVWDCGGSGRGYACNAAIAALELTKETVPEKVEWDLTKIIPPERWIAFRMS